MLFKLWVYFSVCQLLLAQSRCNYTWTYPKSLQWIFVRKPTISSLIGNILITWLWCLHRLHSLRNQRSEKKYSKLILCFETSSARSKICEFKKKLCHFTEIYDFTEMCDFTEICGFTEKWGFLKLRKVISRTFIPYGPQVFPRGQKRHISAQLIRESSIPQIDLNPPVWLILQEFRTLSLLSAYKALTRS